MDNHISLNLNMDGSPYVPGEPPKPRSVKLELVGQPQRQVISQEHVNAMMEQKKVKQGQFAWSLLHRYRGCDPQWLELWVFFVPQRCECKDGYQKILEELPPDFSSPEAFFAWGVNLHNAVNAKLGKPEITLDEAYSIWRSDHGLERQETTPQRS